MFPIKPPVFAHRGANQYAPENTLAAFLKAKAVGITWIEFDVMLSRDEEAVVIHDDTLNRTTNGQGYVKDHTFAELRELDAGAWFGAKYANEKIPTLREVIQLLKTQKMGANIEIKPFPGDEIITTEKIMQIIREEWTDTMLPPLISSFSELALQTARTISSSTALGLLKDEWEPDWQMKCEALACASLNLNQKIVDRHRIQEIKSRGYSVFCYTVNDRMRAQELYSMGVDALFSDWPDEILRAL